MSGIAHVPTSSASGERDRVEGQRKKKPLVVALHGGTCTAYNYDIEPEYTAATASSRTDVPFVAIHRPSYVTTTSILPLAPNETFYQKTAQWLHRFILPALWDTFGARHGCNAIVLDAHSLGVPSSIVLASLYYTAGPTSTGSSSRRYPLAGMILSGSSAPELFKPEGRLGPLPSDGTVLDYTVEQKRVVMLSEAEHDCADPRLFPLLERQTVGIPVEEAKDFRHHYPRYWKECAAMIECPVLMGDGRI